MYNVIIYGIGALGERNLNIIRRGLSNRYKVIGYMDSFYQKEFYQYKRVFRLKELPEIHYDYIVINTYNPATDDEIYSLLREHGVQQQKIIRYVKFAYKDPITFHIPNKVEELLNMPEIPEFEGVLVGMSYAERGIDINQLSGCIYNFAQPAFDLFYRKLTIESLFLDEVKSKFNKLRYIIIELPYYIFNFDVSLCDKELFQNMLNFICYWKEWHHFDVKEENREFLMGFSVFQDMFLKDSVGNFSMAENRRAMTDTRLIKTEIEEQIVWHTIKKYHEKTVKENKHIFHEILKTVDEKSPNIKLIILVCPQPSVNIALYEKYPLQRQVFKEEMKLAQKMYPDLIILDKNELFLHHDEYFADTTGHLNRNGCSIFTNYLDQELACNGVY